LLRPLNHLFHLADLSLCQFFPSRANWSVVSQTIHEEFDLVQRKTHVAGKTNEKHTVDSLGRVVSLAGDTLSGFQ